MLWLLPGLLHWLAALLLILKDMTRQRPATAAIMSCMCLETDQSQAWSRVFTAKCP